MIEVHLNQKKQSPIGLIHRWIRGQNAKVKRYRNPLGDDQFERLRKYFSEG